MQGKLSPSEGCIAVRKKKVRSEQLYRNSLKGPLETALEFTRTHIQTRRVPSTNNSLRAYENEAEIERVGRKEKNERENENRRENKK
jgi:hypothetical protein